VGLFQWQIVDSINMNLGGEYGFVAHCRTTANAVEVLLQYSANKMTDRDWSELHSCKLTSGRKSDFFQAMILGIQGDQVREIKERWPIFQSDPTKATLSQVVKSQVADALRVERGDLESVASAEAKAVAKVAAEAAAKAVVEAAAEALAEATAVATEGRVAPPLSPSGMDGGSGAPLLQEEEGGDDDGDGGDGDDGDGDDGDGDDGDGDGDDGDDENDDDDTTTEGEGDSVSRSSHDDEDRDGMLDGAGGIEGSSGATNSQPIHEKANKQKRKKRRKTKKKKKNSGSSGGSASSEAVAKANVATEAAAKAAVEAAAESSARAVAAAAAAAKAVDRATATPRTEATISPGARMEIEIDVPAPTMADRSIHIPTKDELEELEARLVNLVNVTIPMRRPQGRGRLRRDETTRNRFVLSYALASVRSGKLLSVEDTRFLFMPAMHEVGEKGKSLVSSADSKLLKGN